MCSSKRGELTIRSWELMGLISYCPQIVYWETYDGGQIRELEGSKRGSIDGMDISFDGTHFVTGGADKEVVVCTRITCHCLAS